MFHNARLKLTAWYLVIIMAISIAFSIFIYSGAEKEFNRLLKQERSHYENLSGQIQVRFLANGTVITSIPSADTDVLKESRTRVLFALVDINIIIFVLSALAGYFLAGQTLKPIKDMIDEQHRFITDASHELNTPLTSLKTTIEVNLRNKNLSAEKAKEVLESNLEEVNNLQALSADLIKLTQYQKPNGNFYKTKLSLKEVIAEALEKVSVMAQQKEITIESKVSKITIFADKKSITEVFVILLDNAIKYSPEKKVVTLTAKKMENNIIISVSDQGVGIPKEDLPFIFDRFFRADKSRTKQEIPGYGLGLSIAKKIITLHNGTISAESDPKKGTTFTVTLPETMNK